MKGGPSPIVYAIPLFFLFIGVELLVGRLVRRRTFRLNDSFAEKQKDEITMIESQKNELRTDVEKYNDSRTRGIRLEEMRIEEWTARISGTAKPDRGASPKEANAVRN